MFLIRLNHLIAVLAIFETTALTQQNVKSNDEYIMGLAL
jgi:hypothetical protein